MEWDDLFIFVHGIELALQVIDLFLLGVELLSFLQDLPVFFLNFLELGHGLVVHLLQLVFVVPVDLVLQGEDVLVLNRLLPLAVGFHSRRLLDVGFMRLECVIRQLVVGLLDLGADDLERLSVRVYRAVCRLLRSLPHVAIRAALGHFNRFHVCHGSVSRRLELVEALRRHLIFHVLAPDWALFARVPWRRFMPVRPALVLKLLDLVLNRFLVAANQVFILLWTEQSVVVFSRWARLLLSETTRSVLGVHWGGLVTLRTLLLAISWHRLSESRDIARVVWVGMRRRY